MHMALAMRDAANQLRTHRQCTSLVWVEGARGYFELMYVQSISTTHARCQVISYFRAYNWRMRRLAIIISLRNYCHKWISLILYCCSKSERIKVLLTARNHRIGKVFCQP